jgi:hydroxypyruvate isomerase
VAEPTTPLRCSANVAFLFGTPPFGVRPLDEALDLAAAAGFHTIELLDPWSIDLDDLERALSRRALKVDLFNFPMGDAAAGDRGYAGDPARRVRFAADVERAVTIAERLGARRVNALAGRAVDGVAIDAQLACLADNLALAGDRLATVGVRVMSELLNPVETPGFLLSSLDRVRPVLEAAGGRAWLQLDVYHLQRTHGELIRTIEAFADVTGHVQVADAPSRTEPGTGEVNIPNILRAVAATGYSDLVGLEYRVSGRVPDPFAWVEAAGLERA